MGIHKLTAGSGYDYLTRQVAGLDATSLGGASLASYYSEKGETPGEWLGSGVAGLGGGIAVGDVVTATQMRALFGVGLHPLSEQLTAAFAAANPDATAEQVAAAGQLGAPFKVYDNDVTAFQIAVARRVEELISRETPQASAALRARARTDVGLAFFRDEFGRDPLNAKELSSLVARLSRPRTTAVAGYDLTFSPVKSVSALWAISDPATAALIEQAHRGAIGDALRFLEDQALFTRRGANGVRQVEVRGLVATAFTHRDSRAGDPDLHTHVAIANKVQARDDGAWLSIDGRALYAATVTASETYNTALEQRVSAALGVTFVERANRDPRKRPVREIVGVREELLERWSTRRESINARRAELAREFQAAHGRQPSPIEAIHLAQQATLETRDAKHEPRTLAQQRATWQAEAEHVLGGPRHVEEMLRQVHTAAPPDMVDTTAAGWRAATADHILASLEERRSVWGVWHVRAEAQRRVRGLVAGESVDLVDDLVRHVTDRLSIPIGSDPADAVADPAPLRRSDGASVYTVAGSRRFTSARILAAEQRLVAAAGQHAAWRVPDRDVELALLEVAANARRLNSGQVALVRAMATSGLALQLAIAPAGSGKTTAMQALTAAWQGAGGHVIGLAPSAAAAAGLGAQTGATAHTLATLTWGLNHDQLPEWAGEVDERTLVIIDEAAMAATLDLDAAVTFLTSRGASVRLVGDDQQLAAIGAGGVLRDIAAAHGALELSDVVRFTNPAEAAASLALRDGHREATAFYADHNRIHVGDRDTLTDDTFTGWLTDRAAGLDAIMIAPTRDLVRDLNQRARAHRLTEQPAAAGGPSVTLADGTTGSAGDLIITRVNDRRLAYGRGDWVKNGDRFLIAGIRPDGALDVTHVGSGRTLTLPAGYVRDAVDLGYAATVHTVQGVTVDVMHGLATGEMTRQQLYTMLTRGRQANHIYLDSAVSGDPEEVLRPDYLHPLSPTDLLHQLIARDGTPRSAMTLQRESSDPRTQLGVAADIYADALNVAIHDTAPPQLTRHLEQIADELVPGMTALPAWPAVRSNLLLLAAAGTEAEQALREAIAAAPLQDAVDAAAVISWRLQTSRGGPLPWLPQTPAALTEHPMWGPYLAERAAHVVQLAAAIRQDTAAGPAPQWTTHQSRRPTPALLAAVEVWRAATHVPTDDPRATGDPHFAAAPRSYQRRLDDALSDLDAPAVREWAPIIAHYAPAAERDDVTYLATRLAAAARAGVEVPPLLEQASTGPALPDDQPAAALWWRLTAHLEAIPESVCVDPHLESAVLSALTDAAPPDRIAHLTGSGSWPAILDAVDLAHRAGWSMPQLVDIAAAGDDSDPAQALLWRLTTLLRNDPGTDTEPDPNPAPDDYEPTAPTSQEPVPENHHPDSTIPPGWDLEPDVDDAGEDHTPEDLDDQDVATRLALAGLIREIPTALPPSDTMLRRQEAAAVEWLFCPVSRERMLQINDAAADYYQACFRGSWSQRYLADRLHTDLTGDPDIRPGHAPAGWTHLVDHLRRHGVSDEELLVTGLAAQASTGRLIDRFRDRLILPITHDGEILGFVGRRHDPGADPRTPKYLNTPDTPLYKKGHQLYDPAGTARTAHELTPTLVEGPIDALAINLAAPDTHLGLATLGTALTLEHAQQLASFPTDPLVATDADPAGQLAAERAYWLLTPHGLQPQIVQWPRGADPADMLQRYGPRQLAGTLQQPIALTDHLLTQRRNILPSNDLAAASLPILAAAPPTYWDRVPDGARREFLSLLDGWEHDPRAVAERQLARAGDIKTALATWQQLPPEERWAPLLQHLDPNILRSPEWPTIASQIDHLHEGGIDVHKIVSRAIEHHGPTRTTVRLREGLERARTELSEAPVAPSTALARPARPADHPTPPSAHYSSRDRPAR
ncbi:MAG TPA: MobF family relaxase [Tetrasphaera sp.]|nr:MobF family relaxase [Tetrasphaera sp.]